MSWATRYIEELRAGRSVKFRPHGNSMTGYIRSGQLVQVSPLVADPEVGDIVLCKVNGNQYLHLVKAKRPDNTYQIGNAHGHINGWCSRNAIYGKVDWVMGS